MDNARQSHPMQPVYEDEHGVARFKENAIVRFLLDQGPHDMNSLALRYFTKENREQFLQLIGYSLCGFEELSYVSDEASDRAWDAYDALEDEDEQSVP